jgi:predicted nucleotidyltransferase
VSLPAVNSLEETERRVVERLLELLRAEYARHLRAVWLYGSRARGEPAQEDSDIDLLVVTDGGRERDLPRVTRLVAIAAEGEGADPTRFAVHVVDPAWIEERRQIASFFIQEVDRDKVVLEGRA